MLGVTSEEAVPNRRAAATRGMNLIMLCSVSWGRGREAEMGEQKKSTTEDKPYRSSDLEERTEAGARSSDSLMPAPAMIGTEQREQECGGEQPDSSRPGCEQKRYH